MNPGRRCGWDLRGVIRPGSPGETPGLEVGLQGEGQVKPLKWPVAMVARALGTKHSCESRPHSPPAQPQKEAAGRN